MPSLDYRVVDAFASQPFQGNPAAVVFDADRLTDARMQQIAAEFNLSETVFVLRPSAAARSPSLRLRWFTPQCEVGFCGHATLAAAHAYMEARPANAANQQQPAESNELGIECAAGNLSVRVQAGGDRDRLYWLAMPRPEIEPIDFSFDKLADALQLPLDARARAGKAAYRTRDRDVILLVPCGEHVRALQPDMAAVVRLSREHAIRGVSVASSDTGDHNVACISRFFAPASGIDEDPTTGSVHGPLAALLIRESHMPATAPGQWSFLCRQVPGNGRVGDVHVRARSRADELAVEVGGCCVTVMSGQVSI